MEIPSMEWPKNLIRKALDELFRRLPGEGLARLKQTLSTTGRGRNIDLRTPFYKDQSRQEIVENLLRRTGRTGIKEVDELDEAEKLKVGTISFQKPAIERLPSLLEYWEQTFGPDREALNKAFSAVASLIPAHSLRSLDWNEAMAIVYSTTKSLGLPVLGSDKKRLKWYLDRAKRFKYPDEAYPFCWYWRGQASGSNKENKNRDIWGPDHMLIIFGQRFMTPVLRALRELPKGFSAWKGNPAIDLAMTRILAGTSGKLKTSMDYKGFDKSIPLPLLQMADELCIWWLEEGCAEDIRLLGHFDATGGIVTPFGVLEGRSGGMPSGSVMTNLKDTLVNLITGFYVAYRHGAKLLDYEVMGDDSVFVWYPYISPELVSETVSELGLTAHPEKQYISGDAVHYCQRVHSAYKREGVNVGVRSIVRATSGLTGIEYVQQQNMYMWTARAISQEQQCEWHPNVVPFIHYWFDSDAVLQSGMDPVTVIRKAGGADVVRSSIGSLSFPFSSVDPAGVNEWVVTKVIRSLQR